MISSNVGTTRKLRVSAPSRLDRLARIIARDIVLPAAIILTGDLGAGKTTFAAAFIRQFRLFNSVIPSPTFLIENSYAGKKNGVPIEIHHFDLYRLKDEEELESIGFSDYFGIENGILLIEWGEKFPRVIQQLAVNCYIMTIQFGTGELERQVFWEKISESLGEEER